MALKRIMPCLLIQEKRLVKTINFENPRYVGDPINAVKIYNAKEVDELVVLDIKASKSGSGIDYELVGDIASDCFMPLAYGGGVRTYEDFKNVFSVGVEKIVVNTLLIDNPEAVLEAVASFGSQSIVASIDVKKQSNGDYKPFSHSGRSIDNNLLDYLRHIKYLSVGELIITSVDQEGTWEGFDLELLEYVNSELDIPVIANGGCGSESDLREVLYGIGVQAASVGSMAVYQKKGMGVLIRFPRRKDIIKDE
jgi:imidazole glycerol-phosphate synthase subunit HisF